MEQDILCDSLLPKIGKYVPVDTKVWVAKLVRQKSTTKTMETEQISKGW